MKKDNEQTTNLGNKILNITISVISYIVIILCAFVSIFSIISKSNGGIATIGGNASLVVQSESMTGVVDKGDLIFIKTVKYNNETNELTYEDGKKINFEVGKTVVTFKYDIDGDGTLDVITHYYNGEENGKLSFIGKYLSQEDIDSGRVLVPQTNVLKSNVIGIYQGKKLDGVGNAINFLQSSAGFAICFLLPIALFVGYTAFNLIVAIRENKLETAKEAAKLTDEEREKEKERIRQEILAEMKSKQDENDKTE